MKTFSEHRALKYPFYALIYILDIVNAFQNLLVKDGLKNSHAVKLKKWKQIFLINIDVPEQYI